MSDEQLDRFVRAVHQELSKTAHELSYFPNVPKMLELLALNSEVALITGNVLAAAKQFLDRHDLTKYFSRLLGAEQPGTKSEKLKRLAEERGYSMSSVYYIGDAGTDVEQGRAAGAKTVAVTWGFQGRERLMEEGPDFIVDDPLELLKVIAV